jgi:Domain of unknown function (DUF4336)
MHGNGLDLYTPINVLKPFADAIWIVDGPRIEMTLYGGLPFTTRMTVVRLPDGGLWLHSPTPAEPALIAALAALGPVRHLVAPNLLHYWWLSDWQQLFPDARTHAAPGVAERAARYGRPLRVDRILADAPDPDWDGAFDQLVVEGWYMSEAEFFHRPSRSVILTDLMQCYEPHKVHGWRLRLLTRLGGVFGSATMPRDLRLTFLGQRRARLRQAVRTMIGWDPERIVFAHGRCDAGDGRARLARAFAWLGL